MYTILIVEDEVTSREGIYQLLIQHLKNCMIYSAINGKDGYEKALQLSPDIIIADIQMPEWNGLSMLEQLRKKDFSGRVILLSGFAEFKYAQKAIELGVDTYLLKPVNPPELLDKIHDLLSRIRHEDQAVLLQSGQTSKLYLLSEDDQTFLFSFLTDKNYTDYFLAVVYLEQEEHLPKPVKAAIQALPDTYYIALQDSHYKGILFGFSFHKILHSRISWFASQLKDYPFCTCIYTLKHHAQIDSWLEEYQILQSCIPWSITYHSAFFAFDAKMQHPDTRKPQDLELYVQKIQKLFFSENYAACHDFILDYLHRMQNSGYAPNVILNTAAIGIVKTASYDVTGHNAVNSIHKAVTMSDIEACLKDYFFSDRCLPHTEQHYSKLVQRTVSYVKDHFSEPLSLSSVADWLAITPQYLSKLFVQETNENFIDYLNNYRLEQAQIMLSETNFQINEIAKKTGYSDAKYFCTIFKKKMGITPNQYRKNTSVQVSR